MQFPWADIASSDGVKQDTGFTAATIDRMWTRWGEPSGINPNDFFRLYVYARYYPKSRQFGRVMRVTGEGSYCNQRWSENAVPFLLRIAAMLDAGEGEIRWADRLHPWNHDEGFPVSATGAVDTFPVYVQRPRDAATRGLLHQPKYGATVFKCQLICTFNRQIVGFDFPFMGVENDGHILRGCMARGKYPMHVWEFLLADGAYQSVPHCFCKKKKPQGAELTATEEAVNSMVDFARSRIEQVNSQVEVPFMIFNTAWRGSFEMLHAIVTLVVHTMAVERRHADFFRPVGPWDHDPNNFA